MTDRPIPSRRFLGLILALLVAPLAACASMEGTPIQEYVWAIGHNCEHVNSSWQLDRVDAQGQYWIKGANATSSVDFQQCMREQQQRYPYKEWLAANRKLSPAEPKPADPGPAAHSAPMAVPAEPPWRWNVGDEWQYRWESPRGKGTFVWAVDREEVADGIPSYVVKAGPREIYYRKNDLGSYMEKVSGQIESRKTPPFVYLQWPHPPRAKVDVRYTFERVLDRQSEEISLLCESAPVESVTVAAGSFGAMKISCRNRGTNMMSFELWLAPAVKHMVRDRTYFSYGVRERELTAFKLH